MKIGESPLIFHEIAFSPQFSPTIPLFPCHYMFTYTGIVQLTKGLT